MGGQGRTIISFFLMLVRPQIEECWIDRCQQAEVNPRKSNMNILRKQTDLWQRLREESPFSQETKRLGGWEGMQIFLCVKMTENE